MQLLVAGEMPVSDFAAEESAMRYAIIGAVLMLESHLLELLPGCKHDRVASMSSCIRKLRKASPTA